MLLINFRIPAAVFSLALLTGTAASPAFARSPSSFVDTCQDISVVGNVLDASCDTGDFWHTYKESKPLTLRGIYNDNGKLKDDDTDNPASFQSTCNRLQILEDTNLLGAFCQPRNPKAKPVYSEIYLEGISNDHGNLKY